METGHQPRPPRHEGEGDAVKGYVVLEFNNHSCNRLGLLVGRRTGLIATSIIVLDRRLLRPIRRQRRELGGWRSRNWQIGIRRRRSGSRRCCLSVSRPGSTKNCSRECLRFDSCRCVVSNQWRRRCHSIAVLVFYSTYVSVITSPTCICDGRIFFQTEFYRLVQTQPGRNVPESIRLKFRSTVLDVTIDCV